MDKRLSKVVESGDRRLSLEAIRARLAEELDVAVGRDVAAVAKQLIEVIREIDSLPGGKEVSAVDDIAAARAARMARAQGQ